MPSQGAAAPQELPVTCTRAGLRAKPRENRNIQPSQSLTLSSNGAEGCRQERHREAAEGQEPAPRHGSGAPAPADDSGAHELAAYFFWGEAVFLSAAPPESLPTGRTCVPRADSPRRGQPSPSSTGRDPQSVGCSAPGPPACTPTGVLAPGGKTKRSCSPCGRHCCPSQLHPTRCLHGLAGQSGAARARRWLAGAGGSMTSSRGAWGGWMGLLAHSQVWATNPRKLSSKLARWGEQQDSQSRAAGMAKRP